jgi:hypothetical protein
MKSIQRAHIVVVADSDGGLVIAARLLQMDVARVTSVSNREAARGLCQAGGPDACIVTFEDVPDAAPIADQEAPGRGNGIPTLMIVPAVTPHFRKVARCSGYMAAVPASITPRMLYRRVGAALQLRRLAGRAGRMPAKIAVPPVGLLRNIVFGTATVH